MKKGEPAAEVVRRRRCPYCDVEVLAQDSPLCQACKTALLFCARCNTAAARDAKSCPTCGEELEWR